MISMPKFKLKHLMDGDRSEGPYYTFYVNINRVMRIYEILMNTKESKKTKIRLQFHTLCETIIILLMSSIEVYLTDVFLILYSKLSSFSLTPDDINNLNDYNKKLNNNKPIFNNKDNIKKAFSLFGIDLISNIDTKIWQKIFSSGKYNPKLEFDGYMRFRHRIIHNRTIYLDIKSNLVKFRYPFSLECIKMCILDVSDFIFNTHLLCKGYF